jgi:hypothetical protein
VGALGELWFKTRIDVAETTSTRNGVELKRIERLLGARPAVELVPDPDVTGFVGALASEGYGRATIRKTLQTLGMILDHGAIEPNPVRDKRVRLPREEAEEINPPTAAHVERYTGVSLHGTGSRSCSLTGRGPVCRRQDRLRR